MRERNRNNKIIYGLQIAVDFGGYLPKIVNLEDICLPQGSILGLFLLLSINELPDVQGKSGPAVLFADDIAVFVIVKDSPALIQYLISNTGLPN